MYNGLKEYYNQVYEFIYNDYLKTGSDGIILNMLPTSDLYDFLINKGFEYRIFGGDKLAYGIFLKSETLAYLELTDQSLEEICAKSYMINLTDYLNVLYFNFLKKTNPDFSTEEYSKWVDSITKGV